MEAQSPEVLKTIPSVEMPQDHSFPHEWEFSFQDQIDDSLAMNHFLALLLRDRRCSFVK
jgi:hypothetical protein